MKNLILLFFFIYLVGCLEEEEKPKPKSEEFDAKSFVEETQKLLGEIDNQEKKKNPFSLTKVADEAPGGGKKKFSLTPVEDAGRKMTAYTVRDDLVAWWPFDGDSKDTSGNNRHAEPKTNLPLLTVR